MLSLFLLFIGIGTAVEAQERMVIQATAMGTSTQMGKMVGVKILIEKFSTQDDRKMLIDAFKRSGQDGLRSALEDMKGKGRFSSDWGVGNQIKYIMELPSENGQRHLRLVTDRRLAFGELHAGTRSEEYDVGAVELFLTPDGKGSGTLLPACKLRVDKKKQQLEIETFQNPWKLVNFLISKN
jgi:hypothetical protein